MSFGEDLKAYVDGELPPERMQQIRKAAESDSVLREEIQNLSALSAAIKAAEAPIPVRGLDDTLAKLGSRRAPRLTWLFMPVAVAGCVVLAALFASRGRSADEAVAMSYSAASSAGEQEMGAATADKSALRVEAQASPDAPAFQSQPQPSPRSESAKAMGKRPSFSRQATENGIRARKVASLPEMGKKAAVLRPKTESRPKAGTQNAAIVGFGQVLREQVAPARDQMSVPKPVVYEVASLKDSESLVRQVAKEHGAELHAEPSQEGLRVTIDVPESKREEILAAIAASKDQMAERALTAQTKSADVADLGALRMPKSKLGGGGPAGGPGGPGGPGSSGGPGGGALSGGARADYAAPSAVASTGASARTAAKKDAQKQTIAKPREAREKRSKLVIILRQRHPDPESSSKGKDEGAGNLEE